VARRRKRGVFNWIGRALDTAADWVRDKPVLSRIVIGIATGGTGLLPILIAAGIQNDIEAGLPPLKVTTRAIRKLADFALLSAAVLTAVPTAGASLGFAVPAVATVETAAWLTALGTRAITAADLLDRGAPTSARQYGRLLYDIDSASRAGLLAPAEEYMRARAPRSYREAVAAGKSISQAKSFWDSPSTRPAQAAGLFKF